MDIWIISIIIISALFLGIAAFLKNPQNKINRLFLAMILFVVIWQLSNFFENENINPDLAKLFLRIDFASAIFVGYFWFVFVLNFSQASRLVIKPSIRNIVLFISLALSFLSFTDLIVSNVNFDNSAIRFDNGYLWPVYALVVISFFISSYTILILNLLKSRGLARMQTLYIFVGFSTSSIIALVINLFLSNFLTIDQSRIGVYGIIIFIVCTFYAIIRYRLMDIRVVARKIFIYFGIAVFTYGVYYLVTYIYEVFLGGVYSKSALIAGIFISLIFVTSFQIINSFLSKFANKYLFYSLYNYQNTINELAQKLNYLNDLDEIINLIVDTIKQTMQLDRAGVLLINLNKKPDHFEIAKVIGFNEQNGISLVKDNFLTRYLQKTQRPLVREELLLLARDAKNKNDQDSFNRLNDHMHHIEASLCLPLMSSNKLIGIIVVGSKISSSAFTKEDLELLNTLAFQAGIAIDNARLYKEVQDFSKTLKGKVDEQTEDLKEQADELKAQAEHLKKLLQMRSEFLDIASHQLKTPVSVILGTISMFKEGSIQKLPLEQQNKFIDNIFNKSKKLSTIINDILRASEMDTDEFELVPTSIKPIQVEEVISAVYEDLKPEAEEKGLQFEIEKPNKPVSKILADPDFLEQAIYNLVNNAIKYTAKGYVRIILSQDGNRVIIKIADSGIGIPQTDQKKMFDKFSRAKNAVNMYTDGSGLGLFIVKKIVEAHQGGQISFTSQENKGTTFTISLPIYKGK